MIIGTILIVVAISWIMSMLTSLTADNNGAFIAMQVISGLIALYLSLGWARILLEVIRKHTPQFSLLFPSASMLGTGIVSSILVGLMFVAVAVVPVALWLIAMFAVPGSTALGVVVPIVGLVFLIVAIILMLAIQFFMYAIADGESNPVRAIKASLHITKGNRWKLLWMWLAILALYIVIALIVIGIAFIPRAGGILAIIIGIALSIGFAPYLNLITVQAYDTLKSLKAGHPQE